MVFHPLRSPPLRLLAVFDVLAVELLFPRRQPRRLPLQILLAGDGPLLEVLLLLNHRRVLPRQLRADRLQGRFLLGQLRFGRSILLRQFGADAAERSGEGGRRRRAGELHPEALP